MQVLFLACFYNIWNSQGTGQRKIFTTFQHKSLHWWFIEYIDLAIIVPQFFITYVQFKVSLHTVVPTISTYLQTQEYFYA